MNDATPIALPPALIDNPRLDQWVRFAEAGKVGVATGKVEIGQGVLTAMLQIAAEELDVAPRTHIARKRRYRSDPERGLHLGQPVDPVWRDGAAAGLRRGAPPVSRSCRRVAGAAPSTS